MGNLRMYGEDKIKSAEKNATIEQDTTPNTR